MCGNGGVATGVREVATVEELTAALNDAALHYVRITQDLLLMQHIVFLTAPPPSWWRERAVGARVAVPLRQKEDV
jgi:hypothetical protein